MSKVVKLFIFLAVLGFAFNLQCDAFGSEFSGDNFLQSKRDVKKRHEVKEKKLISPKKNTTPEDESTMHLLESESDYECVQKVEEKASKDEE